MPGGIWGECPEVCHGSVGHNRVGYPTLETAGVLPGALHAKMAWMPELMQTMTPLRGELPLIPSDAHLEDIHIHSPVTWAWIAVLLQYWQDHMSRQLYGGHFRQASNLANTLIRDINPWLPHSVHFG